MLAPTKFSGKQEGSLGEGWKGVKEKISPNSKSFLWALPSSCQSFTGSQEAGRSARWNLLWPSTGIQVSPDPCFPPLPFHKDRSPQIQDPPALLTAHFGFVSTSVPNARDTAHLQILPHLHHSTENASQWAQQHHASSQCLLPEGLHFLDGCAHAPRFLGGFFNPSSQVFVFSR